MRATQLSPLTQLCRRTRISKLRGTRRGPKFKSLEGPSGPFPPANANRASTSSPRLIETVGAHRANRPSKLMDGRLAAVLTVGILLADCSGSTRLDDIVSPRGRAPPRSSTQSMPKYDATGSVGRSKSNIETQVPEKTSPPAPPSQESNRQASPAEE